MTATPSARARRSASRRTIPRRKAGARWSRASASSVQAMAPAPGSGGRSAGHSLMARATRASWISAPARADEEDDHRQRDQEEHPGAEPHGDREAADRHDLHL